MFAEMSEKRKSVHGGIDPVKQRYYDNYAKERKGARHPSEAREKGYESKNINLALYK